MKKLLIASLIALGACQSTKPIVVKSCMPVVAPDPKPKEALSVCLPI